MNADGVVDVSLQTGPSFDPESSGFTHTEFLRSVHFDNHFSPDSIVIWEYEDRRMAQEVLPFLYLGPVTIARDARFLKNHGITMVLAVRNTMSARAKLLGSTVARELGIECCSIDVAGNQELIAAFPKGIAMINTHLSALYERKGQGCEITPVSVSKDEPPGKVLVYCETGNERSPCLVAAYIMAMFSMTYIKAIQIVQMQRFAVAFDPYAKSILQTYDSILQAKRDVIHANKRASEQNSDREAAMSQSNQGFPNGSIGKVGKRCRDEVSDQDVDMDGDDEAEVLIGHAHRGYAPFLDGSCS